MHDELQPIIERVHELASLLETAPEARRYRDTLSLLRTDRQAQDLLSRLITLGHEVNTRLATGEALEHRNSAEYAMLGRELEETPLVKEHLEAHRAYVSLLRQVTECIGNPDSAPEE